MPPKRRFSSSSGPLAHLRQSVAQRLAATAPTGAPEHEAAPPPMEIQLITALVVSTEQSSTTSTDTTGRSFRRSICCKTGGTSASTSTSATRTRGVVVGKKTHEEVRKKGKKIPVAWSDELKLPSDQEIQGRLALDIGSVVRDSVPMRAASYWDLPEEDQMVVYNNISTYYDVSLDRGEMFYYIQRSAASHYKDWMSDCKGHFETYGPNVPVEFVHRVNQWTWLTEHWQTDESRAISEKMKAIRTSQKKVDHTSGSTPFAYRAKKRKEKGDSTPIPNARAGVYEKNAPDAAAAMRHVVAASFEASNLTPPPVEGGSDLTPPAPIVLPLETQIDIVQGEVGVRRGMTICGLGSTYSRDPLTMGGARSASATSEDLRSTIARLVEEIEEQRRYRAEQQKVIEEMQNQIRAILRGKGTGGEFTSTQQQP